MNVVQVANSDHPAHGDRRVMTVNPDLKGAKVLLDHLDLAVHEVRLANPEIQAPWDGRAHKVRSRLPMHRNPVSDDDGEDRQI